VRKSGIKGKLQLNDIQGRLTLLLRYIVTSIPRYIWIWEWSSAADKKRLYLVLDELSHGFPVLVDIPYLLDIFIPVSRAAALVNDNNRVEEDLEILDIVSIFFLIDVDDTHGKPAIGEILRKVFIQSFMKGGLNYQAGRTAKLAVKVVDNDLIIGKITFAAIDQGSGLLGMYYGSLHCNDNREGKNEG